MMYSRISSMGSCLLALSTVASATSYISYSTVTGYFLQDDNSTVASTFDYTATNFGLINRTYETDSYKPGCESSAKNYTQWERFARYVGHLNAEAPANTTYKVLFAGRHGEGYHNAAETFYGTPAWNCYWSLLNGNSTVTWADAHLTANGIKQALIANSFWQHEIDTQKIRTPESYYTSPLYRCLATANLTFSSLNLKGKSKFVPTVKELLREGISLHTCDRRSNETFIHDSFPTYKIEANFAEHDPFWNGITAETSSGQDTRSKTVLDDIFNTDKATWISITSHSGEIASILRVLGHRVFSLSTGAVIPVLVKAETVTVAPATTSTGAARTTSAHCTSPPVTSISGGACVCANSATPVTTPLVTNIP